MWQLPKSLVEEEILCRVPATSLDRFRSTCKQWIGLFNDRRFVRNHFEKAPKQFLVLVLTNEFKIFSLNVDLHGIPSADFKGELSLLHSLAYSSARFNVSPVFHCDGLLLCTVKKRNRIVVWNPCTGQTKWIIPRDSYESNTYTLGPNSRNNSYKILSHGGDEGSEIFDINSNRWKTLDVTPDCQLLFTNPPVSLKGKSYWFAYREAMDPAWIFLVSFDYTTERFERLFLPYKCSNDANVSLGLTIEEKLSVLRLCRLTSKIEIWVRSENDETKVVSWSKILVVGMANPLVHTWIESFLVDEEKKVAVCCETWLGCQERVKCVYLVGEDRKATIVDFGASPMSSCRPFLFSYVPSLVQIK